MSKYLKVKIGLTPSNAPFRISCIRTFLYIAAIAENNAYNGGKSDIVFQIDNTNSTRIMHSKEEIIDFYKKLNILPFKYADYEITTQLDLSNKYDYYFDKLYNAGYVHKNDNNTYSFNINKYKQDYGAKVYINDILNGDIKFDVDNLTDSNSIVIRRADGSYLYNYCAAIDTIERKFTILIRGKNIINGAAFQNLIIKSLGCNTPNYCHVPLLLEDSKANEYNINSKSDIRELFNIGYSYMPVINYIINTGYGDQEDFYSSIEDFYKKFDISKIHKSDSRFDFNIMKKTCNRYYQHEMTYEDYYNQINYSLNLTNSNSNVMNYSYLGYKYKLNPQKLEQLYMHLTQESDERIESKLQKEKVLLLIEALKNDYEATIQNILQDKENKKENIRLVKYILSGHLDGLNCDIYKSCYNQKEYYRRLELVKNNICNERE